MPKGSIKVNEPPPPTLNVPPEHSTRYKGVKHTILVMSGKGGVGKSTFSVNFAVSLASMGYRVGIIDADINGPDDPKMLGVSDMKLYARDNLIMPVESKYGVSVISMGFMLPSENTAVIWRGALRHKAIKQFLEDVYWENTDFVIVDFPPGTGDEAISVAQLIPEATDGVIVVITPQEVALLDARKVLNFAEMLKIKVIGLVENMSGFVCPHCGKEVDIFKKGGGESIAAANNIDFLGRIPIIPEIVNSSDSGVPAVTTDRTTKKIYEEIATKVVKKLSVKQP